MTIKKILSFITAIVIVSSIFGQPTVSVIIPGKISEEEVTVFYRNITVYAPAVGSTDEGYIGIISTITVKIQSNGSGRVFVDTLPLTQVDMQGSARLAVKVASTIVENDENCDGSPSDYDYFFVVRTDAPIIGGPSAGAVMTVATISLLENWEMSDKTVMTGMINPDGSIGPIGGIPQKIDAAYSVGATHFLIPEGQGTYTEMVVTTENIGGWIRTVTKPVTRNVVDYAMDNYGITVTEVADIYEALEYFTGYKFSFNNSNGEITTQDYIDSMTPLATNLLENARDSYENASSKFKSANIPNQYPTYYKNDIQDNLEASEERLKESEDAYQNETYYTSTSKSFQSLIFSRFISYTCDYWDTDDDSFMEKLLQEVKSWYNNASKQAKNAEINGFISLQSVGAAQRRASEAKQYLDSAESMYEGGISYYSEVLDFLYKLSFAYERSNSISWWISIGSYFNETGNLDKDILENLALEYIEEAQQSTFYSTIILNELSSISTESSSYLNYAEDLLETSRDDLEKGYPASALFQALEATVRANLAIEIIGVAPKDRIQLASETASSKIAKSRQQGIEPVLAVSYYEYSESLVNESDFDNALLYYKYSGMIAGVLSFTNSSLGTTSSRYFGLPNIELSFPKDWYLIIATIGVLSIIAGIGLGLIISGISQKRIKDRVTKKERLKHPYFSNEDMPRSIKDYYKNNKF